ncbi:D-aminoacyl-tRNA deacylase [Desulfuromonas sp. AOP6]|uniref:D-aminoacyl-tRNA deacylase n=1 Tax=Desulfuromonas sp. AOP6 TaxID=1566351 RepID=UPI0012778A0D|nr:D-aminoacyl-tRNA deacylase [Desulfuromonas sp. AOP6]BCA78504.1 D-aminoacyl-tRNA deacylase [Desulfuromonas sp. AOP6]
MRAVLQRVTSAHVEVAGRSVGAIGRGLLVLLGVAAGDSEVDAASLADKIIGLRIFEDDGGKMNLSVADIDGEILAVSQFTLLADCRKGRRPGFSGAAPPERALELYDYFVRLLRQRGFKVPTGVFQADMAVHLVNDGPVTLLLDSRKEF